MPKTHWDGLLFSEAGTPRGLFGSSRRVLPSPSSPSSSSLFIFSLYSNQISPFISPAFFGVRATVAATIQRVIHAKEPLSKEPWRQNLGELRTCTQFGVSTHVTRLMEKYIQHWGSEINCCWWQRSLYPAGCSLQKLSWPTKTNLEALSPA